MAEFTSAGTFGITDYLVFIGMLAVSSGIGLYFAYKNRKNHSNKEFLTSNRSLSLFPVAMSLLASFQSSVTILGYPAEMFYRGTQFWMVIISSLIASTVAAELFLPVFYKLGFTSVNQYLEQRFTSSRVRLAVSFSFLLCTVPYMGVVLYGPSLALETVTGLSVASSIMIIGTICTVYTSIGGIKAVIWTDVVQVILMFAGLLVVMFRGFFLAGGVGAAFAMAARDDRIKFFNMKFDIYSTTTLWNCVIGMGTMWSGNYATSQTEVQRYCNVTTERRAKLSLYLNFIGVSCLISCACLCGIALYGFYSDCDPLKSGEIQKTDQLMPYFVIHELAQFPGVAGLFVSCVFSASLSTMSSGFNALATVTYDDFLSKTSLLDGLSEKKVQYVSKIIAMGYGIAAIGMAFVVSQIDSILEAAISIAGALVGPMFGLFLLGILVPFANSFGVLCGLFVGELFGIWVLIGSMIYPKKAEMLNTSIDNCPAHGFMSNLTSKPVIFQEREGLENLYHVAFLLVPVFGCIISIVIGLIASLLSNGHKKATKVRPEYLSVYAWCIWPKEWMPEKSSTFEVECPKELHPNDRFDNNETDLYSEKSQIKKSLRGSTGSSIYMIQNRNSTDSLMLHGSNKNEMIKDSKKKRFTKQNAFEFDDREFDDLTSRFVVGLRYSSNADENSSTETAPTIQLAPTPLSSSSNEGNGSSRSVSSSSLTSSPSPVPSSDGLLNSIKKETSGLKV